MSKLVIGKDRSRLYFNDGYIRIDYGSGGGPGIPLDEREMMELAAELIGAVRRLRKRKAVA